MQSNNMLKILAALSAGLILCGCTSNNGDGGTTNSPAQGIYCGSFTASFGSTGSSSSSGGGSSSSSGSSSGISSASSFCGGSDSSPVFFGMVQADGTAVFFTRQNSNLVLYAPAAVTTASFSLPVTAFGLNGSVVRTVAGGTDNGTLNGTVSSGGKLSGSLSDDSGNNVDFVATANADTWARTPSLATIAGSYKASFSLNSTTYTPTLAIAGSGDISGTDSSGCTYGGVVTVPDPLHNDYNMSLTSSCLSGQTFNGIGAYFPAGLSNPNGLLSPAELKVGLTAGNSSGIYLNLTSTR